MKRIIISVSSLAAVVLLAGLVSHTAFAERGWGGHRGGGPLGGLTGPRAEFLFEALDLTPEQRDSMEAIQESYRPQLRSLRQSGRDNRRALAETTPDDPDYATVVAAASQAAAEHASQLVLLTAEMRREVHTVLTAEQRAKARELRDTMRERVEDRRQQRREWRQQRDAG